MNQACLREKVLEAIWESLGHLNYNEGNYSEHTNNDLLQVILHDSIQALYFVTTLEEEFHIEFEDDEVDSFFFSDFEYLIKKIRARLENQ